MFLCTRKQGYPSLKRRQTCHCFHHTCALWTTARGSSQGCGVLVSCLSSFGQGLIIKATPFMSPRLDAITFNMVSVGSLGESLSWSSLYDMYISPISAAARNLFLWGVIRNLHRPTTHGQILVLFGREPRRLTQRCTARSSLLLQLDTKMASMISPSRSTTSHSRLTRAPHRQLPTPDRPVDRGQPLSLHTSPAALSLKIVFVEKGK